MKHPQSKTNVSSENTVPAGSEMAPGRHNAWEKQPRDKDICNF